MDLMGVLRDLEFRSCAKQAYGRNWQWRMALDRDVNLRTVQSWAARPSDEVPEDAYAHVRSLRELLDHEEVAKQLADLVAVLRRAGISDHVIAGQLLNKADELSSPDLVPRGAPPPKEKKRKLPTIRSDSGQG